mgnify:CR=1 FL=1
MLSKILKTSLVLISILLLSSCDKLKPNTFILNGNIEGNYSGYIYLTYNYYFKIIAKKLYQSKKFLL